MSHLREFVTTVPEYDGIKTAGPIDVYKEAPFLEHGRIESRTCRIYDASELIADCKKWSGDLTVVEILTFTEKKSNGSCTSEQRLYVASMKGTAKTFSLRKNEKNKDLNYH